MKYVKQFAIIMGITCLGELLNYLLPLPIPASIYGMVLLFLFLLTGGLKLEQVEDVGDFLVSIMPVMFIPAAVGIMDSFGELQSMLVPVLLVMILVTCMVMVVAGKVTEFLSGRKEKKHE